MKARITSPSHVWPYKRDAKLLRVRVDFYPDSGDPLYDGCHVQAPERGLTPGEESQIPTGKADEKQLVILGERLAAIPNVWGVNPINCRKLLAPVGFTQHELDEAATVLEGILAGIPKVWRVNPINCHFFLLPLGFTQDDLDEAVRERIKGLKQKMTLDAALGHTELHGLPSDLCFATCPPKGEGQALIPTSEKEWTPALVEQAGLILDGHEISEAKK